MPTFAVEQRVVHKHALHAALEALVQLRVPRQQRRPRRRRRRLALALALTAHRRLRLAAHRRRWAACWCRWSVY